jgi:glycosyltransferase involved in cell wall biosynthesis
MSKSGKNLYIVWNPFQRRAESMAVAFDLETKYFHFKWEERGRLFKAISYAPKFFLTIYALFKDKPKYVFVQLAPTPLLYAVAVYKMFSGNHYISDCHNTMLYDDHWIKWPLAKELLRWSYITLVHNDDVREHADRQRIESRILRDPLPVMAISDQFREIAGISLKGTEYVIIPCSMAADEPVQELFDAARKVPSVLFMVTWFSERLPTDLRTQAPNNIRFTGFLPEPEFNTLYANANAALVLTTREGTQPSGAAEAISLGIPLLVSEIRTTKRLYKDAPLYVKNDANSIAAGIRMALDDRETLSEAIAGLRESLVEEVDSQINAVKKLMAE